MLQCFHLYVVLATAALLRDTGEVWWVEYWRGKPLFRGGRHDYHEDSDVDHEEGDDHPEDGDADSMKMVDIVTNITCVGGLR